MSCGIFIVRTDRGFVEGLVDERTVGPAFAVDGRVWVEFLVVREESTAESQLVFEQRLVQVQLTAEAAETIELRL